MSRNVRSQVLICAAATVTTLGVLGCNDESESPPAPAPAAQQGAPGAPVRQTTPPQTPDAAGGAAPPAAEPRDPAPPAAADTSAAGQQNTPAPRTETTPPPSPQSQPPARTATQPPAQRQVAPANDSQAQARELIDQVRTYATNMQWKEADQAYAKLKMLRGKVPEDLKVEIDNVESYLKAQKAVNNVR